MNNANAQLADDLSLIESLSKLFALVLGSLYLLGFLVVASHLSRYGVSSFSVLQLQYLIAGGWVLGPPVIFAILTILARRFESRAAPAVMGRFNWRGFVISLFFTGIPSLIFIAVLVSVPTVPRALTWRLGICIYIFYTATFNLAQIFWQSWRTETGSETAWKNRTHAAPFYLGTPSMIRREGIGCAPHLSLKGYIMVLSFMICGGRSFPPANMREPRGMK